MLHDLLYLLNNKEWLFVVANKSIKPNHKSMKKDHGTSGPCGHACRNACISKWKGHFVSGPCILACKQINVLTSFESTSVLLACSLVPGAPRRFRSPSLHNILYIYYTTMIHPMRKTSPNASSQQKVEILKSFQNFPPLVSSTCVPANGR